MLAQKVYGAIPNRWQWKLNSMAGQSSLTAAIWYGMHSDNIFDSAGLTRSLASVAPVNASGEPVPWFTVGGIQFLNKRLSDDLTVFEYGSGNSTRWFAERVQEVIAVEHDSEWAEHVRSDLPDNVTLLERNVGENYVDSIRGYEPDVIVIDGKRRPECVSASVEAIAEHGVLILDNFGTTSFTEPSEYSTIPDHYNHIPFYGIAPQNARMECTAVFYPPDNCVGI